MASPASSVELLCLFERLAPNSLFADLIPEKGVGSGKGIYSFAVVIWLMIVQRLHTKGTLSSALQQLLQVRPVNLLPDCKRVRDGNISPHPGGYCQARQNMPTLVASKVCDHVLAQLQTELPVCPEGCSHPVFLLDGSSLELASTAELAAAYPPAENQHGAAHWPILRIAVMHNLANGLALRPSWGPMSGPDAVGEQALAETLMDRLPPDAVIVGDRNFGIFSVVYAARKKGFPVILRLTKERFQKVWKGAAVGGQDRPVEWLSSRSDRRRHPDLPPQVSVTGRILVAQMQSGSTTEFLYLFATLDLPAQQILEIYRCRWNIETDLRSLKATIRLHHIAAKTSDGGKRNPDRHHRLQHGPGCHGLGRPASWNLSTQLEFFPRPGCRRSRFAHPGGRGFSGSVCLPFSPHAELRCPLQAPHSLPSPRFSTCPLGTPPVFSQTQSLASPFSLGGNYMTLRMSACATSSPTNAATIVSRIPA